MPIKKRTDKGRHLDAYRREMLHDGPDAMLLAGCGYLAEVMVSHYATAKPIQQKAVLEAMRADWQRHRGRLLAAGGDWSWTTGGTGAWLPSRGGRSSMVAQPASSRPPHRVNTALI